MALIRDAKGRRKNQTPSGYTRLFGIPALGSLMSRVQGTVISAGTELEKLIYEQSKKITDLDTFINTNLHSKEVGIWVANKHQVKNSKIINSQYEPDFLAFDLMKRICYVIEVKDGDQFDTKKAAGEHKTLHDFTSKVSNALPFSCQVHICSFNANSKQEVYDGLKRKFELAECLTGKDLCILFGIEYTKIIKARTNQQRSNLEYFVTELLAIPKIKTIITKRLPIRK